jgi:hypothetical protein
MGGGPGYPAHVPPCWGAPSRLLAAGRSPIARWQRTARRRPPTAPAHSCVRSEVGAAGTIASRWAGSPAASSPTALRPNAPSSSPNSSAPPGRRCGTPSPATAWACPLATRRRPPARHRRRPPAQRPVGHPGPGPSVRGPQSQDPPGPSQAGGRAVPVGPPRGAVRHLGRQRGGRAIQRKPRPPAHHRAWAIIQRADRSHRLADQRASRPDRRHTDRTDRTSRSHQPQERAMAADAR